MNARAARMANIVASVPEFVNRMRSTDGSRRADLLGQLDLDLGRRRERRAARDLRLTASTTAGWAWPRMSDV